MPLRLIIQSEVDEMSKSVSLHMEATPAFTDFQGEGKG